MASLQANLNSHLYITLYRAVLRTLPMGSTSMTKILMEIIEMLTENIKMSRIQQVKRATSHIETEMMTFPSLNMIKKDLTSEFTLTRLPRKTL